MRIDHVALWTPDLQRCKRFYVTYFGATAALDFADPRYGFESCFLSLGDGARIEVMQTTELEPVVIGPGAQRMGLTHLSFCVGSELMVDLLTRKLEEDGFPILDAPQRTADGYYESVVLDPDGNRIEITV
jgi:lactoylglutathione lyase